MSGSHFEEIIYENLIIFHFEARNFDGLFPVLPPTKIFFSIFTVSYRRGYKIWIFVFGGGLSWHSRLFFKLQIA